MSVQQQFSLSLSIFLPHFPCSALFLSSPKAQVGNSSFACSSRIYWTPVLFLGCGSQQVSIQEYSWQVIAPVRNVAVFHSLICTLLHLKHTVLPLAFNPIRPQGYYDSTDCVTSAHSDLLTKKWCQVSAKKKKEKIFFFPRYNNKLLVEMCRGGKYQIFSDAVVAQKMWRHYSDEFVFRIICHKCRAESYLF